MRYIVISPRNYSELESILCIFSTTKQFEASKDELRKLAQDYYKDKIKMDKATKEDASIYMDDYMNVWDFREDQEYTKVKNWYTKKYPSDELGKDIASDVTFMDVFEALDNYRDIYELLKVDDSVIRERVFTRLAEITHYPYDVIYEQWLKCVE